MRYLSFEKSVGCVVYRKLGGQILFLLVQYRSWQWDFPKGHVESDESEQQTMRREVKEETGVDDLKILSEFRTSVRYFYTAKGNEKIQRLKNDKGIYIFKKVVFFAAQTEQDEIKIDFENKAFAWLTFQQALNRLGNDDSKKILRLVANELKLGKNEKN